jgi:DNA helicase HerA-like ATPase
MLNIEDLLQTDGAGHGIVNVLAADKLMQSPRLYATFLLWMLSELYEQLPEIGDPDKPRLVFFFDEAHLLFDDAPKVLVQRIELVVRLIRSKGVGVYFATQNPLDVPDAVLAQLGNRVQHALRAFTPRDQKAVRATAETMRQRPGLDIAAAITELAVGEALVSLLDEQGRPGITDRAFVFPPASLLGPIDASLRATIMQNSLVAGVYEKTIDRESAYEKLAGRTTTATLPANTPGPTVNPAGSVTGADTAAPENGDGGMLGRWGGVLFGTTGPRGGHHDGLAQTMAKSAVRTMGTTVGREIIRGVLGGIFGSKRR